MNDSTPFDFKNINPKNSKIDQSEVNNKGEIQQEMPSQTSVDNILRYSKAISVRKSDQIGFIENLLN